LFACVWNFCYLAIIEHATKGNYREEIPLNLIKQAEINCRQHEVFLRMLLHDSRVCAEYVQELELKFGEQLGQLKSTVQSKSAVPTSLVYVDHFPELI
jgi:hypothetical protein